MTDSNSLYTNSKMEKEYELKRITKETKALSFYSPIEQNKTFYNSPLYKVGGINSVDFERSKLSSQPINTGNFMSDRYKITNRVSRMTSANICWVISSFKFF